MRILRITISATVLLALILGAFVAIPPPVSARELSGTSSIIETNSYFYLPLGYCAVGDIIWWYWIPSGMLHCNLYYTGNPIPVYELSFDDGYVVQTAESYFLMWFNMGWSDAFVSYWIEIFTPTTTISTPTDETYLDSCTVSVKGTTDGHATGILVGPDALHLRSATTTGIDWELDGLVLNEGQNTILVRSCYLLDNYGYKNHTIDRTIHVILDTIPPDLALTSPIAVPSSETYLRWGRVDVSWQCSDDNGIASREVMIDALGWQDVATDSFSVKLADGHHLIQVRVTDVVGHVATAEIAFVSDTVGPQVTILGPEVNAKITKNHVVVSWSGIDNLSGIDHYEIKIIGGDWVDVGRATSYEFTNLDRDWYTVYVKAVDKSGNSATSTVRFGIYAGMWSMNGPYPWIPWFTLIAAVILAAILSVLVYWRKRVVCVKQPPQEPPRGTQ